MNTFDRFLEPVSEAHPCGDDESHTAGFLELDNLLRGKAETQFSAAEDPDWKALRARCEELLGRSRHLYPATILCLASLQTDGLPGGAAALAFLSRLVQTRWPDLHPRLDPADALDPLERMNILGSLTAPPGSFGDAFRFIERLSAVPLAASPRLGRFSLRDCLAQSDATQWGAAFQDTPPAEVEALAAAASLGRSATRSLAEFLVSVPGGEKAPSFDLLEGVFASMEKLLQPFRPQPPAGEVPADSGTIETAPPVSSGTIASRQDVLAALDRICAFYESAEPGSPVPLLLKRARRLVSCSFLEIMADLAPEAVPHLQQITGSHEGNPPGT